MRKFLLALVLMPLLSVTAIASEKSQTFHFSEFTLMSSAHAQEPQVEVGEVTEAPKPAQSVELPAPAEGDPTLTLIKLVTEWKAMSPVAIGAMVILLLIQLLKSSFFGGFFKSLEWKRFFITFLGIAYGVVYLISSGTPWLHALVVGLLSSGGAVAIYQALKPILDKKKA